MQSVLLLKPIFPRPVPYLQSKARNISTFRNYPPSKIIDGELCLFDPSSCYFYVPVSSIDMPQPMRLARSTIQAANRIFYFCKGSRLPILSDPSCQLLMQPLLGILRGVHNLAGYGYMKGRICSTKDYFMRPVLK